MQFWESYGIIVQFCINWQLQFLKVFKNYLLERISFENFYRYIDLCVDENVGIFETFLF